MIYFIAKSSRAAGSSRHRAWLMADALNNAGVPAEVLSLPHYEPGKKLSQQWAYLKKIFSLRRTDTVIMQNLIRNRRLVLVLAILRIIRRPTMIFDLDDASYIRWPWITKTLTAIADKIIVASHYLATWPGFGKRPILIMPNLVDAHLAERYAPTTPHKKVVVGWIGGAPASMENLRLLIPALQKVAAQKLPFILKIVGTFAKPEVEDAFRSIPGLETEFVPTLQWAAEGEIQKVNASFDIGLCPLVENEDNRARCSLKIVDYMAAGLPVVASPVGENNYFLEENVTGFLPAATEAWAEKLTTLITDSDMRRRFGIAARQKLKKEFSYAARIKEYQNFLQPQSE